MVADTKTIIGAVATLCVFMAILTNGFQATLDILGQETDADRRAVQSAMDAFRAEAVVDREAFRSELHRLAERQAPVEGALTTGAADQQ